MENFKEAEQLSLPPKRTILFPLYQQEEWREVLEKLEEISEIRIRVNQPVLIYWKGEEFYLSVKGSLTKSSHNCRSFTFQRLRELLEYWCENSRYAYEAQIKKGYLTLRNGHRAGLCGETVLTKDEITNLKYISSVNLRIAHQIKNIAKPILPHIYHKGRIKNLLILSPPGAGKTTLLRDTVRLISEGNEWGEGKNIALIDERKEIAACYQGIPQLDVGKRTDIMDGCPKKEGMKMVLRAMSPQVIAVDELQGEEEVKLIRQIVGCGASIIATAHADSFLEWKEKENNRQLISAEIFCLIIELSKENGRFKTRIYEEGRKEPCCVF